MTTSNWDNAQIQNEFSDCQTLSEIIKRLETNFSLKGEVICEISVNGVILSEDDESKFAASPAHEVRDLAVRSNRPADLIVDAMNSAFDFTPELEASCMRVAELFRSAAFVDAQNALNECLDGCQWLVDTLMHVRSAASGIKQPIQQPERWFEAEKTITRVVRELSEAYTAKDYVLVADLLEYELTGAVAVWREALAQERASR